MGIHGMSISSAPATSICLFNNPHMGTSFNEEVEEGFPPPGAGMSPEDQDLPPEGAKDQWGGPAMQPITEHDGPYMQGGCTGEPYAAVTVVCSSSSAQPPQWEMSWHSSGLFR